MPQALTLLKIYWTSIGWIKIYYIIIKLHIDSSVTRKGSELSIWDLWSNKIITHDAETTEVTSHKKSIQDPEKIPEEERQISPTNEIIAKCNVCFACIICFAADSVVLLILLYCNTSSKYVARAYTPGLTYHRKRLANWHQYFEL